VTHLLSPKDLQDKGLSKLFLAHLWIGPSPDLDVLRIPAEWCATLPPMQHYHAEYYQPENKPNFPPPPLPDTVVLRTDPPPIPEFVILCRATQPPETYWSDVSFQTRSFFAFPTPYLESVARAISGMICHGHSSVGDPQEINVLRLHGAAYCQSLGVSSSSTRRLIDLTRPGYFVPSDGQIVSGGLVWGSGLRTNPLPCNPRLVSALLKSLRYNSWCQVLEFGDCVVPHIAEDSILRLFADVCRTNTTLLSITFPPRQATASPILPLSPQSQLWSQISDALLSNPRPLFSSFDFTNCHLGDEGVRALCPALRRLFSRRNSLMSIKFNGNDLSAMGVELICEAMLAGDGSSPFFHLTELSFGDNPWCGGHPQAIPVRHISAIIRCSPHLQKLNLEATDDLFPIHSLKADLIESGCPLTDLALGGVVSSTVEIVSI
jgi:hypothetical protein